MRFATPLPPSSPADLQGQPSVGDVDPISQNKDRPDPEAAAMQQRTDPHQVLAALDERRETEGRSKHLGAGEGADAKE